MIETKKGDDYLYKGYVLECAPLTLLPYFRPDTVQSGGTFHLVLFFFASEENRTKDPPVVHGEVGVASRVLDDHLLVPVVRVVPPESRHECHGTLQGLLELVEMAQHQPCHV